MGKYKNTVASGFCIVVGLSISSCSDVLVPRDPGIYPGGIHNQKFTRCRLAINRAYRGMICLKYNHPRSVRYADWSNLNNLLAGSLAAMQFGDYPVCLDRAHAVIHYIQVYIKHKKLECLSVMQVGNYSVCLKSACPKHLPAVDHCSQLYLGPGKKRCY